MTSCEDDFMSLGLFMGARQLVGSVISRNISIMFYNICSKCLEESHAVVWNCHTPSFDGVFSSGADAILFKYVDTSVKEGAPECSSTCA